MNARVAGVLTAAVVIAAMAWATIAASPRRELRVCADPDNLPFSNERREGFENRLAELVAEALDARVTYTW